jgi:hypothetical protein
MNKTLFSEKKSPSTAENAVAGIFIDTYPETALFPVTIQLWGSLFMTSVPSEKCFVIPDSIGDPSCPHRENGFPPSRE